MRKGFKSLLIVSAIFFITIPMFTACATSTGKNTAAVQPIQEIVETQYGLVQGFTDRETNILVWKGLPYAKAPVGDLRWKAPEDPEVWTGLLEATESGNMGIQYSWGKLLGDEDCLNLDIYRPDTDEHNLPVMLYIHGGNNQTGTSEEIDPSKFVNKANSVVVSVNYRLGILGFNALSALNTGDPDEDSGNYTLLDFEKALDWIGENITEFGGDPHNITIAGFSAGGRDVMAMLLSPIYKGKFHKAISLSGGMTLADRQDSEKVAAKALSVLAVEDNVKSSEEEAYKWLLSGTTEVRDYLYSLPAERLASLMGNAGIRMSAFPHLFTDGAVLPKDGFETQKYNNVPLIMITGSDEFTLFGRYDRKFARVPEEDLLAETDIKKEVDFALKYGNSFYELFNAQESAQIMLDSYKSPIYTGKILYGRNNDSAGDRMANIYGAFHGIWIPLMTGIPSGFSAQFPHAFSNEGAKDLSEQFMAYIGNFLWAGNPNGEKLVQWDSWVDAVKGPSHLLLDVQGNQASVSMTEERADYFEIIGEMEEDSTIPDEKKDEIIREVLNGRWFSRGLDEYFNNESLWIK